ncbi:MAG: hypothetical protein Q7U48_13965 [Hydrogenophaga sp.]|nr:hypothetical protein [Hydrogenophaga sp.]
MKSASLKRVITNALALAAVLTLGACASPRTATLKDGEITHITSAEAVTLAKQGIRKDKVADVQKNAKPMVRMEAHAGQPITINAKVFEVYVPQDLNVLLAETPDAVSENVQMADKAVRFLERVAVPLGLGAMALNDRNNQRASNERINETNAQTEREQNAASADQTSAFVEALTEKPAFFVLPAGATAVAY